MRNNHVTDKPLSSDVAFQIIDVRVLRTFANGLAHLCGELGLVQYDIVCRFMPRERPEYATIETRSRRGKQLARAENILPVPLRDDTMNGSHAPDKTAP